MFSQAVLIAAVQYISGHQSNAARVKDASTHVVVVQLASLSHSKQQLALALAIAEAESGFDVWAKNKKTGAYGLMQVLPRYFKKNEKNDFNAIVIGVELMKDALKRRSGVEAALAYYNGGWRGENSGEARAYAQRVTNKYKEILRILEKVR